MCVFTNCIVTSYCKASLVYSEYFLSPSGCCFLRCCTYFLHIGGVFFTMITSPVYWYVGMRLEVPTTKIQWRMVGKLASNQRDFHDDGEVPRSRWCDLRHSSLLERRGHRSTPTEPECTVGCLGCLGWADP